MRILFLDFDGVLHPITSWASFAHAPRLKKEISQYPDVKVVVHSSWRHVPYYDDHSFKEFLDLDDSQYYGVTDIGIPSRWESIQDWLSKHPEVRSFKILDDLRTSFDADGQQHLIATNGQLGMQEEDWQALKAWLEEEESP